MFSREAKIVRLKAERDRCSKVVQDARQEYLIVLNQAEEYGLRDKDYQKQKDALYNLIMRYLKRVDMLSKKIEKLQTK